jgi:hypothetical protein
MGLNRRQVFGWHRGGRWGVVVVENVWCGYTVHNDSNEELEY